MSPRLALQECAIGVLRVECTKGDEAEREEGVCAVAGQEEESTGSLKGDDLEVSDDKLCCLAKERGVAEGVAALGDALVEVGVEAEAGAAAATDAERVALVVDEEGLLARRPLVLHRVGVEPEQIGLARARVCAGLDGDLCGEECAENLGKKAGYQASK